MDDSRSSAARSPCGRGSRSAACSQAPAAGAASVAARVPSPQRAVLALLDLGDGERLVAPRGEPSRTE